MEPLRPAMSLNDRPPVKGRPIALAILAYARTSGTMVKNPPWYSVHMSTIYARGIVTALTYDREFLPESLDQSPPAC